MSETKSISKGINKQTAGRPRHRYYVGIDCGVNTGFAIWDSKERVLVDLATVPIHKAMNWVRNWSLSDAFIRVEDARKREWLPKEKTKSEYRGRLMGAGSVMRDAKIWEDFLIDLFQGCETPRFEMVAPKRNKTKMGAEQFARITGWNKRCSVHARDAAMLVVGY